jgi:hypothetical protein
MTYAGDLLRSGQGYSFSSADQIVMLCRLIARPDRIGFSAPKVEQAIDARREVTNGLLIPRGAKRAPVRGQRALPFDLTAQSVVPRRGCAQIGRKDPGP